MKKKSVILVVILFFAAILLFDAFYKVSEVNQVIITQFGEPIGGTISSPGLHLKIPFIQKTNFFEKRVSDYSLSSGKKDNSAFDFGDVTF